MSKFRTSRSWLKASAAVCALSMAAPGLAFAQDADEEEEDREVITVTGIRASIESSIAAKRDNTSIVEAISAEDIGKLPDVSIAESLARLPGLAAQRVRGRAQVISVRGLGPDYTTALFNGREQVTAGDNRGVEFDQYPSELISQALVYKTPDAQLVAQGLAGTVDLRSIRPLDYDSPLVSLSGSYEWTDNDELNPEFDDNGYRITGTYVDQFANDTIGIVLSFAEQNTPTQGEKYEITNFENRGGQSPEAFKMFSESRDLERSAFLGTLEFEPSETFNTSIDIQYTEFADAGVRRGIELSLASWHGATLNDPVFTNGLLTSAGASGAFGVARNDVQAREAELFNIGWNAQWQFAENWTLETDISRSSVERTALDFESYSGVGEGTPASKIDELGILFTGDRYRFGSSVNYADPNTIVLTDPGGWGQDGFYKTLSTDDELTALRASVTHDFNQGALTSIEFGLYYTMREKARQTDEFYVDLASGNGSDPIPTSSILGTTSLDWVSNVSVVAYDPVSLLNDGTYSLRPLPLGFIPNKQWQVEEDVLIGYIQNNFDSRFLNAINWYGNFGVQFVHTEQSSTGPVGFGTDFLNVLASDGNEYTEVLPSFNSSFEFGENTFLRVGAARTLARARMDDMRASVGIGNNSMVCADVGGSFVYTPNPMNPADVCISGGSGNPQLLPYTANSYDISLEHYFGDGAGYWSVAAFHKEIDNWVFGNIGRDFDATAIVDDIFGAGSAAANPGVERARFFAAENTEGGWLRGLEFSLSLPAETFLPERFDGLGLFATYSLTDSEIQPPTSATPITIPGLSEDIGNITVYYERGGWEARLSNRWRGDFLAELPDFTGQPDFRSAFSESIVDAQIGYEFTSGVADGLTLLFQANNLTDERFGTFINGDERQARNWEEYGATYTFRAIWRR